MADVVDFQVVDNLKFDSYNKSGGLLQVRGRPTKRERERVKERERE